jgi:hypothetical protein
LQEKQNMADDITVADPSVVLDLLTAFRGSKAMFAAVSLGAFDAATTRTRPSPPRISPKRARGG